MDKCLLCPFSSIVCIWHSFLSRHSHEENHNYSSSFSAWDFFIIITFLAKKDNKTIYTRIRNLANYFFAICQNTALFSLNSERIYVLAKWEIETGSKLAVALLLSRFLSLSRNSKFKIIILIMWIFCLVFCFFAKIKKKTFIHRGCAKTDQRMNERERLNCKRFNLAKVETSMWVRECVCDYIDRDFEERWEKTAQMCEFLLLRMFLLRIGVCIFAKILLMLFMFLLTALSLLSAICKSLENFLFSGNI